MMVKFSNQVQTNIDRSIANAQAATGRKASVEEMGKILAQELSYPRCNPGELQSLMVEYYWHMANRPFFNAYPAIVRALCRTSLDICPADIPKSVIHELKTVCVKLPVDKAASKCLDGITHFFISVADHSIDFRGSDRGVAMAGQRSLVFNFDTEETWYRFESLFDCSIEQFERSRMHEHAKANLSDFENQRRKEIARIGVGVMMLAANSDFVKPVLLRKDVERGASGKTAEDRAKRRGVFGFDVGKEMECVPHIRRPHFGIRWTGKGRKKPMLVPISGALVHKNKLTTVPTGFEGTE